MTKKHFKKVEELKQKGWLLRFEVNLVMNAINCIIYNEKQESNNRVEKVSVWNNIEDGIDWLYEWKLKKG